MRASFPRAIEWLALNDDCAWAYEKDWSASVAACLVADLFGKTGEHVRREIVRFQEREGIAHHAR